MAIIIGYGSHLLCDSLTRLGVNWLHPLSNFVIQGPMFTGGMIELFVFLAVVLLNVALLVKQYL